MDSLNLPLPSFLAILLHTDDQDQWPPEATLLVAAHHGNVRRLKEIAKRMDVNGKGVSSMLRRTAYEGMNALHAAAGGKGMLPICRYLVEEVKMDVNKRDTFTGKKMTPLQHAVFGGNLPVVRYLLDHGADLHQEGDLECHGKFTALHTAAEKGRCAIAKFLLSRGAYVDGKSCHVTPVHLAVFGGHDSTLKILLDHNADPNKGADLSTPLDMALRTPSLSCLKLLIQAGAEVNGFRNPLAAAAQEGLTEAIKCLLEAGADPNTPDVFGRIPIELAAVYGTSEDVEILFPFTSPIPTVTNWSVDGIINHMKLERKQLEDENFVEARKSELKKQGDDAFRKQDYINASAFYTQAMRVDRYDAGLFSNRSLCWLRIGDGRRALRDATWCNILRPKWVKAYFQKAQALMLLKDYEQACNTLATGLELDPLNDEADKLYWEAMELKNGSTEAA
ncbi:hypothetical protein SETIT_9G160400v2 [Setaria italica]|uniref:Serine/threonine-protein kinase BSK1-like TPR repeats domain-containing protein n=1 Tax=Setaria italica TaxID=4555 RepID=K4A9X1_SETIT|nr:hypothetical protein SETIT_9G160400v2 [Setaria italica]